MSALPNQAFPSSTRTLLNVRTPPTIRLDAAQRQSGSQAALAGHFATLGLFNNSNQNHLLVVRGLTWGPSASGPVGLSYNDGLFGTVSSTMNQPIVPTHAALPGQVVGNENGTLLVADFILYLQSLEQSLSGLFPAFVLPPGWMLVASAQTADLALTVSFLWEALTPDQFVESYGEYAG